MADERFVLALAGGVGGGKLARGLAAALPPEELAIVVNTADDFVHLGLHISPDVDSVLYALGRPERPGARLGPCRRNLEFHGGDGAARRRDLVQARRPRSGDACPADRGAGRRPHISRRSRRCWRSSLGIASRGRADDRRSGAQRRARPTKARSTSRIISCGGNASRCFAACGFEARSTPGQAQDFARRSTAPTPSSSRHPIRSSASIRSWRCRGSRTRCGNRGGRSSRCRRSSAARR